jgi:hypothetical protein
MHQKLYLPEERHFVSAGLPDEKPATHSSWATAQLDELPAAGDGTLEIQDTASESWDATSRTRNIDSGIADVELSSVHGPKMGL